MFRTAAVGLLVLAAAALAADGPESYPPPKSLGPVASYGANVQRAMTLLATSTPDRRNPVRVVFYGQSITAGGTWAAQVARDLRRRFPFADLRIENRALPGYTSNLLVHTAEADLYPAYPDLAIFHVYGPHAEYEAIIRRLRERTTADILHTNDHLTLFHGDTPDAAFDPARHTPAADPYRWQNHVFLPDLSRRYATELADVRGAWRDYLRDHKLGVADLLADQIHQNAQGDFLMAEVVKAHLRHRPDLPPDDWADRVTTHAVGAGVNWEGGTLTLPFDGNRVDLLFRPGASGGPVGVKIDGKRPSEFPELYLATRAYNAAPAAAGAPGNPVLLRVGAAAPRVVEQWVLTATVPNPDRPAFRFAVAGSATGPDGEGEAGRPFVSDSGRVTIAPADLNLPYLAMLLRLHRTDRVELRWNVVPLFADQAAAPPSRGPGLEAAVTVAQGLRPGPHVLELSGGPDAPLEAVRVFRPPLRATD